MSKKPAKSMLIKFDVDPTECPFREFRDHELGAEFWGMSPSSLRNYHIMSKVVGKPSTEAVWQDEQVQPLPRSIRRELSGWKRAEELADERFDCEVVIFEDTHGGKMAVADIQLSHPQVLHRSSFCRRVLESCFMLERVEGFTVEHQWEGFTFTLTDGWRPKYHVYSPGMKPGGGTQHRPIISKNGCYLVRLFYLGAWRCVWVNDLVPVDASDAPLLPFSPLFRSPPALKPGMKAPPASSRPDVVHLWPLLLCKALLKLAAPDMNDDDEDDELTEDEEMPGFDIVYSLTGCMNIPTLIISDVGYDQFIWETLVEEVPTFSWDDDEETAGSTVKSKAAKKPTGKESNVHHHAKSRHAFASILIEDTKSEPPYALPGVTPGFEMTLLVSMARDLPLKKPLPEPEVPLWKTFRWVDWAKRHGLYDAYACPRDQFLKVNGLLKLSHAPHLLDVQSTESVVKKITVGFRVEQEMSKPVVGKKIPKDMAAKNTAAQISAMQHMKEELREWLPYSSIFPYMKRVNIMYYPSMFEFTTAASSPSPRRPGPSGRVTLDIPAQKSFPLYLQVDSSDITRLSISLSMQNPQVLFNAGVIIEEPIEPAYAVLERFELFKDYELARTEVYVETMNHKTVEVWLPPGRHFCRVWLHSLMNWHIALLSKSTLVMGSRDVILSAAARDCPWAAKFLSSLSLAFTTWIRINKSNMNIMSADKDFYKSYQPDLDWNPEVVGYNQALVHWMFRQALQSLLHKRLSYTEYKTVSAVLRRYFYDPDFGLPPKPPPPTSLRENFAKDPCDCTIPEPEGEEAEDTEEELEETELTGEVHEEKPLVDSKTMQQLLTPPAPPVTSQVCELATEQLPCGVLKEEREKTVRKHEAATVIQAHWRGTWARKCLQSRVQFTTEVTKILMENAFGNLEALAALMNEFFSMYPGAKYAYSVASALSGTYGLTQYHGTVHITPKNKWVPFFQGVFFCHKPAKVHIDVQSTLPFYTMAVYDNDTEKKLPQTFNAHITFDVYPNELGYTIMSYSTLSHPITAHAQDVHWQLTVLSSHEGAFHCCDNTEYLCKTIPLPSATTLSLDEIFIPNRRNIIGGIQITVVRHETISFRVTASSPELQMEVILRTTQDDEVEEVGRCSGKGEIHWPYIRLIPLPPPRLFNKKSNSQNNLNANPRESLTARTPSMKAMNKPTKPSSAGSKKSATKMMSVKSLPPDQKIYSIEVIAKNGWPLTLNQWIRVDEVRNDLKVEHKIDVSPKKPGKDKATKLKEIKETPASFTPPVPQAGDAFATLECSYSATDGANARRDDTRDFAYATARRQWDINEPGRNNRGAHIRSEFRKEFLEHSPPPPTESDQSISDEFLHEEATRVAEEAKKEPDVAMPHGPSPISDTADDEMSVETEEESKYLLMPDQLRDKFIPLYYVPMCTKDIEGKPVILTAEKVEAAKTNRQTRIDAALARMQELQLHNEVHVLGRQKLRAELLERLFVDSQWDADLTAVLEQRDQTVAEEVLARQLSATKKKKK